MKSKICGKCKHFEVDAVTATCEKTLRICDDAAPACKEFEQKPITNGDVLRQICKEKFANCIDGLAFRFSSRRDFVAWLNAPAESEVEND